MMMLNRQIDVLMCTRVQEQVREHFWGALFHLLGGRQVERFR